MMNVADIAERISHPEQIRKSDLEALKELTDKYPYSQIFPILYLKGLSSCADIHFDEELQKLSYRISDRVQLYTIIHDHTEQEEPAIISEEIITESAPTVEQHETPSVKTVETTQQTEQEDEIVENSPPAEENEVVEVQKEEPAEPEITEAEDTITEPVEPKTDAPVQEKQNDEETGEPQKDKLEETIMHYAFAANYHLEELTPEEDAALKEREKIEEKEETKEEEERTQAPHSFTGWLHADSNYVEQDNSEKEAINALVEGFADFDPTDDNLFGEVEKPKAEFFSPAKKAKESLDENKLPVSETLAKIYTMQGNYPKAIAAYQELSLAFPEKKIFFANLIKDLEKKLNK